MMKKTILILSLLTAMFVLSEALEVNAYAIDSQLPAALPEVGDAVNGAVQIPSEIPKETNTIEPLLQSTPSVQDAKNSNETVLPAISPEAAEYNTLFAQTGLYVICNSVAGTSDVIYPQTVSGKEMVFLPAYSNYAAVTFGYDENVLLFLKKKDEYIPIERNGICDLTKFLSKESNDASRYLDLYAAVNGEIKAYRLYFMKSSNIAAAFINTDDPADKGYSYIFVNKDNKATGKLSLINADGAPAYIGALTQIKTRGNSTWACVKKPFQIKLDQSFDLIQTGDDKNKSKTWILLANAFDPTLIHNSIAFDMASRMGINAPDFRSVDLYFDGKYIGNYLLCEKIEEGKGRVNIGKNGFLLEMDVMYGYQEEYNFTDISGTTFVIKNPEKVSKDQLQNITNFMNEIQLAAQNGGISPNTGVSVWDLVDIDSLAKYYVFSENVKNPDAFISSTFFYVPENGKLTAGPVWDYDSAFGVRKDIGMDKTSNPTANTAWIGSFLQLPEFRMAVKKYEKSLGSPIMNSMINSKIAHYTNEIAASEKMNRAVWSDFKLGIYYELPAYSQNVSYMKKFMNGRSSWFRSYVSNW